MTITIAATGHRPDKLGGYKEEVYQNLTALAQYWLEPRMHHGIKVISGMAQGWDQAVASAAIELDIPFIAAIPFEGQESIWPEAAKQRYYWIRDQAEKIVYVSEPGYAGKKMMLRNRWMVDRADTLLALWNGVRRGGTYSTVAYAERVDILIVNLYNLWKNKSFLF